ncbi:hypothetical protein [Virgibacillus sediminis]|uniref:YpzI family protein n=1 Tax=Virgibacillus sediminis TaxID=202260 RepID=A0ABV7A7J0_9BACI
MGQDVIDISGRRNKSAVRDGYRREERVIGRRRGESAAGSGNQQEAK